MNNQDNGREDDLAFEQENVLEKIYELIDYGAIVTFYDHGTHVAEVSMFLDERRTLEPQSIVLTHAEAEQRIAALRERNT